MFEAGALVEGAELIEFFTGAGLRFGGFLAELDAAGIEAVPLLGAHLSCSGPIEQPLWNGFWSG